MTKKQVNSKMKKIVIIFVIGFIIYSNITIAHEKEYQSASNSAKLGNKLGFDFKKIAIYLGIFDNQTISKITQKMYESVVTLSETKNHSIFDISTEDYNKNLILLKLISKKDDSYIDYLYNKLHKSIILLTQLHSNKSDVREKIETSNLISNSLELFFDNYSKIHNALRYSKICKEFSQDIKYLCYQKFITNFADKSPEEISLASAIIKKNVNAWDCHFLLHDFGFSIAMDNNLEQSFEKCGKNPICTYGCEHGIALGYITKQRGGLNKSEFVNFNKKYEINSNPSVLNFYHGFGHGFFGIYDNTSIALSKCRLLYDYTDDIRTTNLCAVGGAHEKFFFETEISFENFSKDFESCKEFKDYDFVCKIGAAYGYSQEKIWQGDASLEPVQKTLDFCKRINDEYCYYGIGLTTSVIAPIKYSLIGAPSSKIILESIDDCYKIFADANITTKYACNAGAAFFRLVFYQELDSAFFACNIISEYEDKTKCFNFLNKLITEYSIYNKTKDFCSFLSPQFREECLKSMLQ